MWVNITQKRLRWPKYLGAIISMEEILDRIEVNGSFVFDFTMVSILPYINSATDDCTICLYIALSQLKIRLSRILYNPPSS